MSEDGSSPEAEFPTVKERIILKSPNDTIVLKQLIPEDAQNYFDLIEFDRKHLSQHGDDTAVKYLTKTAVLDSITHPKDPKKLMFGIWDGEVMVGSVNLRPMGMGRAETSSWIGKKHIGNKYAARARSLLIDYAFNSRGYHELWSQIDVNNIPSRKSVERSGYDLLLEYEGTANYILYKPKPSS